MGRPSTVKKNTLTIYDKATDTSRCLLCDRILKGNLLGNIKRHYMRVHSYHFESDTSTQNEKSIAGRVNNNQAASHVNIKLTKSQFLKCCVGLATLKDISFDLFDEEIYFKRLIEPYEKAFDLNINSDNVLNKLKLSSMRIKNYLKTLCAKKMISLKIDLITRIENGFLVINIQYIKNFKICVHTIDIVYLKPIENFIENAIVKCLKEFNIELSQIYFFTIDSDSNMLNASLHLPQEIQEQLGYDKNGTSLPSENDAIDYEQLHKRLESTLPVATIRCTAQLIEFSVRDTYEIMQNKIEECREAAKILRSNINSLQNSEEILLPVVDNLTQWKSTYEMIGSLSNLIEYIQNNEVKLPFDIDWHFVCQFLEAFKPIVECSKGLQTEQYIIGDFYRDWLVCETKLERMGQNVFAEKLLASVIKQKEKLLDNKEFLAALYFDPRFNYMGSPLINDRQMKTAVVHISKTSTQLGTLEGEINDVDMASEDSQPSNSYSDPYDILEEKLNPIFANASGSSGLQGSENLNRKLDNMPLWQRVPFGTNALEYWKNISMKEKELGRLAEVILAVPLSEASVERFFNAISNVSAKDFSKLDGEVFNDLLYVNINQDLLDCIELVQEQNVM